MPADIALMSALPTTFGETFDVLYIHPIFWMFWRSEGNDRQVRSNLFEISDFIGFNQLLIYLLLLAEVVALLL